MQLLLDGDGNPSSFVLRRAKKRSKPNGLEQCSSFGDTLETRQQLELDIQFSIGVMVAVHTTLTQVDGVKILRIDSYEFH